MTIGPRATGKRMIYPRSAWTGEPRQHRKKARAMAFVASAVTIRDAMVQVAATGQGIGAVKIDSI